MLPRCCHYYRRFDAAIAFVIFMLLSRYADAALMRHGARAIGVFD